MDINLVRGLVTAAAFVAFAAIVWWAYAPARRARFERDARLPFDGEAGGEDGDGRV
jgi:cytochrome c oxidase cbb3-type subunit 4